MVTLRAVRTSTTSGGRIELILNGPALAPQLQFEPVFFELDGGEITETSVLDGFIGAILHYLMESRHDLHVEGRLSKTALRHLTDYQRYWSLVKPGRYATIQITADEIVADRGGLRTLPAVANFSGGIDSAFTVVRHSLQLCGMDTVRPEAVLVVHGFDVPLADQATFARLLDRLQPVMEQFGLHRYVVRTNLKEMAVQDWLDSYSAQLVSCLHTVCHRHSTALVASDGYAQSPLIDFGGNPISVPLLSTSRMNILYDGAQIGRTDKVAFLANYPQVRRSLKFCWQGPDPASNCGRCPKCLLTYLNFRAIGVESPECFDFPISEDAVGTFSIRNYSSLPFGYEVLQHLWKDPALHTLAERFSAPFIRYEREAGLFGEGPPATRAPVPTFPVRHTIPHSAVATLNGGNVSHDQNFTAIETDPRDWAYSAGLRSDNFAGITGPGRIDIRLQVDRGKIGVLVLTRGSSVDLLVPEQGAGSWRTEPVTLRFEIPDMQDVGDVVLRGWPSGGTTSVRIFEIDVMCNRPPPATPR